MKRRFVYNLEFPSWCPEINLFGYRFFRVDNYKDQIQRLQQVGDSFSEFEIKANTGEHAITAYVEIPRKEKRAILEWSGPTNTALLDIQLLLSLFTGRDVFSEETDHVNGIITKDPQIFSCGGSLRPSIPYIPKPLDEDISYNIGFEDGLNQIYTLIRSETWQKKYHRGYFLFLAKQAFQSRTLEASYIQCWTIWEHLFTVHNQCWLSEKQIHELSSYEKIAFLLIKYGLCDEVNTNSRKRIMDLSKIRNRLVHFGRLPESQNVYKDAIFFVRLTEFILVKILGLLPSNVFNTIEMLEDFIGKNSEKVLPLPP
jgi:hypothetical protein